MARQYNPDVSSPYDALLKEQAQANGLSYEFLRKLTWYESDFNPNAQSPTGPKGIMQFTEATGRAMGLKIGNGIDERLDPNKAIPAAARHLAELSRKANGDMAKVALMYNQGEGKLGAPQLQAYSNGQYDKISEEGRKYIEALTGKKLVIDGKVGITPKATPDQYNNLFEQTPSKSSGVRPSPVLEFLNNRGDAPRSPAYYLYGNVDETIEESKPSTFEGVGEATLIGLKNTTMGQFLMSLPDGNFDASMSILKPFETTDFDSESREYIFKNLKDLNKVNALSGVKTFDGLKTRVNQLNKVYDDELTLSSLGTGSQIVSGFAEAFGDPLSYVPLVGAASKFKKGAGLLQGTLSMGAQTAGAAAIGETLRSTVVGGEADFEGAILGGFAFGAAFKGLSNTYSNFKGIDYGVQPTMARAEARMKAEQTDGPDLSKVNTENLKFEENAQGIKMAKHPTEEGAVILEDGTVISKSNPLNPETVEKYANAENPVRAYKGLDLGGISELSTKAYNAESDSLIAMSNDLMRPSQGLEGQINKMTAEDIHSYEQGYNHIAYKNVYDLTSILERRALSLNPNLSQGELKQQIGRKVVEYLEGKRDTKLDSEELDLFEQISSFFTRKEDNLMNPSKFGNTNAKPVMTKEQFIKDYFPVDYDKGMAMHYRDLLGVENFKNALKHSYLESYKMNPEIRQRVDYKLGVGTEEFSTKAGEINESDFLQISVEQYADGIATGIAYDLKRTSSYKVDDLIYDDDALLGIENNRFLEERHLFGNSYEIPVKLDNGEVIMFSPNDIRNFDVLNVMSRYARRVDGDVAIMGSTGKTTQELKQELTDLRQKAEKYNNVKDKEAAEALGGFMQVITGRARRDAPSLLETFVKSLGDIALLNKGWYIPLINLLETAGMVGMNNTGGIIRSIPILKQLSNPSRVMKPEEIQGLHRAVFGEEISNAIRPSRDQIIQGLTERSGKPMMAKFIGSLKYSTQEATARTVGAMITGTTNMTINKAREGILGDLVGEALGAGGNYKWRTPEMMKAANITEEQYEDIMNLIRENVIKEDNGKFKFKDVNAFQKDPRTMSLWRYGDYVAQDIILQPQRAGQQDFKDYNAYIKAALMFKKFTIRAINGKTLRSWHQATKNGRAIEKAMTIATSIGFASLGYMATTHLKALGMPESERKKYLEESLDPAVIGLSGVLRSSELAGLTGLPLNLLALAGYNPARNMRTTLNANSYNQSGTTGTSSYSMLHSFGGRVMEQVPAASIVFETLALGYNASALATNKSYAKEYKIRKRISKNLRNLAPNDFMSQKALITLLESTGMPTEK